MPICEVCGKEAEAVYRCNVCGISFCRECGSVELGLCLYCKEEYLDEEEDQDARGGIGMPICEVCGNEAEAVYECTRCGVLFCAECGYPEAGICAFCRVWAEYVEDDVGWAGERMGMDDEEVRRTDEI